VAVRWTLPRISRCEFLLRAGQAGLGLRLAPQLVALAGCSGPIGGILSGRTSPNRKSPRRKKKLSIGTFAEAERQLIARALKATEGNKVQAAAMLRISRKELYAKIEKYGLIARPASYDTIKGSSASSISATSCSRWRLVSIRR
jgi:Bacterial regulatory protein, Fis family